MTARVYLDTSALAKWYLNEPNSDAFEAYARTLDGAAISRLGVVEFRCLLARRRRAKDFDVRIERRILRTFEQDIKNGALEVYPLEDRHAVTALDILNRLTRYALRTLDALHLAIALDAETRTIATADRVMAETGKVLGIEIVRFD
ncbi:MAG: type II toxin-antitoxin system VapC family toxin [Pseudomonadota bacterium]